MKTAKVKPPKPRLPLPEKPPKVEPGKDTYRRKPKHPKQVTTGNGE